MSRHVPPTASLAGTSVAFVNPPLVLPPNFVNYPLFASLGLLSTAGLVERLGAEVQVMDAFLGGGERLPIRVGPRGIAIGSPAREVAEALRSAPDVVVVGASMFAHPGRLSRTCIPNVLSALARRHPRAVLVLADMYAGGIDYLPYDPRDVLRREPRLAAISTGEGESSVPVLLAALAGRRPFAGLPRVAWRFHGAIRCGPVPGPLVTDLDPLLPAFHLLDMERYFRLQIEGARLNLIHEHPQGGRFVPLLTSRGCPFHCAFCAKGFGTCWRACSPGAVLRQVEALRRRYRVERFFFMDDCINAGPRRFEAIVRGMAAMRTPWEAPNGFRADRLSAAAVRSMIRSGMLAPSISAESGDAEVLQRVVGKGMDPAAVARAAGMFSANNRPARVHFIIGFPDESRAQINATLEAAAGLFETVGAEPRLQFATPLPGTALYRRARETGSLLEDTADVEVGALFTGGSVIRTPAFGPAELERFAAALRRRIELGRNRKTLLAPSYRCNSRCLFCCTNTLPKRDAPLPRLIGLLRAARRRGAGQLDIDGGEPTLYPQLPALIAAAKNVGFDQVTLVTNARMAAYPTFARELRAAGLDAAVVTLLGASPELHDSLSRAPDGFAQAIRGIANLASAGLALYGNVVLLPGNIAAVAATAQLLAEMGCRRVNLMYPVPVGLAARGGFEFPALGAVRRAVSRSAAALGAGRIAVHNLPPCLVPRVGHLVEFGGFKPYMEMIFSHGSTVNFGRMLARLAGFLPECAGCTERVLCGGLWRHLLRAGTRPDRSFAGLRVPIRSAIGTVRRNRRR